MPSQGFSIGSLHEVRARFDAEPQMQEAVRRLEMAGFDRADLSLPEPAPPPERATPESGAEPVDTEEDARQARTVHTSTAAAAAAMLGAGVVAATGGAALPVVAAAVGAAGLVGGATFAVSTAVTENEQHDLEARAATGTLILSVRTPTDAQRDKALAVLKAAGAMDCTVS